MKQFEILFAAPKKLQGLSREIANTKRFKDDLVFFQITECDSLKSLEENITTCINPSHVLLFENIVEARENKDKAHSEILEQLRLLKFSSSAKIIVVMPLERENELIEFVNELIKLDIQNFYFVDVVDMDEILRWLLTDSKTLNDNQKYVITKIDNKKEKEVIIKEVPKYITVSDDDTKRKSLLGFMGSKTKQSKNVEPVHRGPLVIGVTGTSKGIGTTTLAVELAMRFFESHKKVLLLDRSGSEELKQIKMKGIVIASCPMHEAEIQKYDYVVIDFGIEFELGLMEGMSYIMSSRESIALRQKDILLERKYCSIIVCVASAAPWKLYEVDFYINNPAHASETVDWIFFFSDGEAFSPDLENLLCHSAKRNVIVRHSDYLADIESLIK